MVSIQEIIYLNKVWDISNKSCVYRIQANNLIMCGYLEIT